MKKSARKVILSALLGVILLVATAYSTFLFALPKIVNSKTVINKITGKIYEKTQVKISADNLKLNTFPNLSAS